MMSVCPNTTMMERRLIVCVGHALRWVDLLCALASDGGLLQTGCLLTVLSHTHHDVKHPGNPLSLASGRSWRH
jgi:hypothetical protein